MPLFNDDDEKVMTTMIDIVTKWSEERPEAARQGIRGLIPAMLRIVKQKNTPRSDEEIVDVAEGLISDIEKSNFEDASTRLDDFLSGPVPSEETTNESTDQ